MTLTRHGHHIPGSPQWDEKGYIWQPLDCGGMLMCRECRHEADIYLNGE